MQGGRFDGHVDHRRLDSIVNRLVLGVLCAALFGVLGYRAAVVLAWRQLWSVVRSDRRSRPAE